MPSDLIIRAVLLIPAEGDPLGLLREGACGAAPPTAVLCRADERERSGVGSSWHLAGPPCREHPRTRALVLAWAGATCPDGVFRAWHRADDVLFSEDGGLSEALYDETRGLADIVACWRRDGAPLGVVVLLDADGQEVPRAE